MLLRARLRPVLAGGFSSAARLSPSFRVRQKHTSIISCVTVSLDPSRASLAELKEAAIDGVEEWLTLGRRSEQSLEARQTKDAVVILVSKSMAQFLDDEKFISRIINATGLADTEPRTLSVLSAAVDEVPRYDRRLDSFCSSEGVSVLCGNASRVLPNLWSAGSGSGPGTQPSLEFRPPKARYMGPVQVTVPLANTMFSNGMSHALSASRWETCSGRLPLLVERIEKTKQEVVFGKEDMKFKHKSVSTVACGLVPITQPRKIVAGLGNILRQVDIDGSAPASTELERVIPTILDERRISKGERDQDSPSGPVGVWALILPAQYVEDRLPIVDPLNLEPYHPKDELCLVKDTNTWMDMALAAGGQLRKVLSGGGGWGQKKGLLSLDPQNSLDSPEHEDLESFINSFKGEGGIVAPGSYVQFFMEAARPSRGEWSTTSRRLWDPSDATEFPTVVAGTPGTALAASPSVSGVWPSLFGAVSSEGIYLSSRGAEEGSTAITTKLDSPRSYMVSTERFLTESGAKIRGDVLDSADDIHKV